MHQVIRPPPHTRPHPPLARWPDGALVLVASRQGRPFWTFRRIYPSCKVTEAESAGAAEQRAANNAFDLIVMDEHFGLYDPARGSDAIAAIRRHELRSGPGAHRACIVSCSGDGDSDEFRTQARSAGADLVWPKPFPDCEGMQRDLTAVLGPQPAHT